MTSKTAFLVSHKTVIICLKVNKVGFKTRWKFDASVIQIRYERIDCNLLVFWFESC